jgi:superfamily I DNA and RNA helicase
MALLKEEVAMIKQKDYKLEFMYPTKVEMNKLNIIHRDKTKGEINEIERTNKDLKKLIESLESGKLHKEDLSSENLSRLKELVDAS